MSRRAWVLFTLMGIIWGIPYLFIKVAVEHMSPASLVFYRTLVGALLLAPIAASRGHLRPLLARWKPLLMFSLVEVAGPWYFLSSAERRISSSLAGLLIAAVPLIGALLGWLTGTDRLDWRRSVGLLIGFGGVAALVGLDLGMDDLGALLEMAAVAVGYAIGPFILTRYLADLPQLGVVAASLIITTALYTIPAAIDLPSTWPPVEATISVLVLGVICTAVAFLIFFKLIEEAGPVRATVITYINPAVAVVLGVVFLSEPFTLGMLVGFVLVLLGSALATRRSRAAVREPTAVGEP